ncbi:hypothetical protein DOTSEDRAFT_173892 [Dothistroma septosporum NZE10]|uniref:PH domain-like protein n=1 Tax=Dothistroma septosporum (strain NZE10 / CBS 128990) TaxID=675120 RepID=M2YMM6_DOTSN|nr:hypothetical protein DOTSEDRAFT_173892 [Dothistroma septosporum NZE10]
MPPKKKASRAGYHPPPQPIVSDYDTDTANLTDTNAINSIPEPPPDRSNAQLNNTVLRRWIPDLESILAIAPFAVLYNFSPETEQWDKCETQGSLFVLQLIAVPFPRYQVVILNRRNPENLQLNIVSTEQIEVTNEFIIITTQDLQKGTVQVQGIWMYSDGDIPPENSREAIAQTIMECAQKAEQYTQDFGPDDDGAYDGAYDGAHAQDVHDQDLGAALTASEREPEPESVGLGQLPQEHKLDLATLFGKSQAQQIPLQQQQQQICASTSDSDFFRIPAGLSEQTQRFDTPPIQAPSTQQSALLDLFKNAKRE